MVGRIVSKNTFFVTEIAAICRACEKIHEPVMAPTLVWHGRCLSIFRSERDTECDGDAEGRGRILETNSNRLKRKTTWESLAEGRGRKRPRWSYFISASTQFLPILSRVLSAYLHHFCGLTCGD